MHACVRMQVRTVPSVIDNALAKAGLPKEAVDWLVMHQANQRIIDAAATVSHHWLCVRK